MMMRGLGPHTQKDYVRHVKRLAAFLRRPPDTATEEDLRRFQLMQHESGVRPTTINSTVSALRFLYTVTLTNPLCERSAASRLRSWGGGPNRIADCGMMPLATPSKRIIACPGWSTTERVSAISAKEPGSSRSIGYSRRDESR